MEQKIVSDLNPAWSEMYLAPLRENDLRVYTKDLNLDGWIRSIDVFLVYDDPRELELARRIIEAIEEPENPEDIESESK